MSALHNYIRDTSEKNQDHQSHHTTVYYTYDETYPYSIERRYEQPQQLFLSFLLDHHLKPLRFTLSTIQVEVHLPLKSFSYHYRDLKYLEKGYHCISFLYPMQEPYSMSLYEGYFMRYELYLYYRFFLTTLPRVYYFILFIPLYYFMQVQ